MADLVITAANVIPGDNAVIDHGRAGEVVTAGKTVYFNLVTKRMDLSKSNHANAVARVLKGIALHAAAVGQPLAFQTGGDLNVGAVLTLGAAYYQSETAGGIQPAADLAVGETVALIGLAKSTSVLSIKIQAPGVTLA